MDSEDEALAVCAGALGIIIIEECETKKKRFWARKFLLQRHVHSLYNTVLKELYVEDRKGFRNFIRMTAGQFETLLQLVAPHITKMNTNLQPAISPEEQLVVTLRFLATGNSYTSLMYSHKISLSKISETVPRVCSVIIEVLKDYIKDMDHDLSSREACPVHVTDSLITSDITENEGPAIKFETVVIKSENNSVSPSYQYLESQDFAEEHSFTESNQNNFPGIAQFLCETVINTDDFIEGSVDDLSTSTSIRVVKNNFFIEKEGHSPGHNAQLLDTQSRFGCNFKGYNSAALESQYLNICTLEDNGVSSKNITFYNKKIAKGMRLHNCDICQKSYVKKYNLGRHMIQHTHKTFICDICQKSCVKKYSLVRHMAQHTNKKFICDICQKSFTHILDMHTHRIVHSKFNIFLCHMCGKICSRESVLENHMYQKHSPKRDYECADCGNIYSDKETLRRHLVCVHQGYKRFKCILCNKEFSTNSHLKRHLNWHTGYKAYKCVVCERAFTQRTNLNIHMVTHTGVKKFVCPICQKSFTLKQSLNRHMKTHIKN